LRELSTLNWTIENGIESYYNKGINLIKNNKDKDSDRPLTISSPKHLTNLSLESFEHYEEISEDYLDRVGFVLVAGGFGERLGS